MVILETNGKGIADLELGVFYLQNNIYLPILLKVITQIVSIMSKNFTSTLEQMFIMNPSFIFSNFWPIVKRKYYFFIYNKANFS